MASGSYATKMYGGGNWEHNLITERRHQQSDKESIAYEACITLNAR